MELSSLSPATLYLFCLLSVLFDVEVGIKCSAYIQKNIQAAILDYTSALTQLTASLTDLESRHKITLWYDMHTRHFNLVY